MEKIFTKEVKIALTAIVAIVLLFFGLNFLKGLSMFSSDTVYKMSFTDLKGLSKSTAIYANGYKVGTVTDILFDYEKEGPIEVLADIDKRLRIPAGTTARIESDLMGNIKVVLVMGKSAAQRLQPGDMIEGVEENGMMAQVADMMPTVQAIVPKIDSIMTSLNLILSNPAIINMLQNMDGMSANLNETTRELNGLLKELHGEVPVMMKHVNTTLTNTERLSGNLANIDLNATMSKIDNTLSNVENMTNALNNREGTLGLLMYDKGVYNNLNSTMMHADSLMIDLKAHPKRYVHFSVFGSKDK